MTQTFLDIDSEFNIWDEFLQEAAGELTPEIEALRAELELTTTAKLERAAYARARFLAHAEVCKQMAAAQQAKALAWEAKAERIEGLMQPAVERLAPPDPKGRVRVQTPTFLLWVQPHTSERVVEAPGFVLEQAPEGFLRRKVELDKTAVKVALKAGETIPGLVLEQNVSFGLRVK